MIDLCFDSDTSLVPLLFLQGIKCLEIGLNLAFKAVQFWQKQGIVNLKTALEPQMMEYLSSKFDVGRPPTPRFRVDKIFVLKNGRKNC